MSNNPAQSPALGGLPLVLGGNVFGWTADKETSFAILDAYYDAGGRMIDTAEAYSMWVPGHKGGESELVIGEWMESRGNRTEMKIATKFGVMGTAGCLAPDRFRTSLDASLERLRTDYIDLYYAHRDDPETPQSAVAEAFDNALNAGKIRAAGCSNFTLDRLMAARDIAAANGYQPFSVIQNEYNLLDRTDFEGPLQDYCIAEGVASLPYYGLAAGFLTGKYRNADDLGKSVRGRDMAKRLERGLPLLAAMDDVAAETGASLAQIALAWLIAQPGVSAPIASATSVAQLSDLLGATSLKLDDAQLAALTAAA